MFAYLYVYACIKKILNPLIPKPQTSLSWMHEIGGSEMRPAAGKEWQLKKSV